MATLTQQEKQRVDKYLHTIAKLALELTDKFYILLNDIKIDIAAPFRKAVDVATYPTYPSIVKEPMDMSKMKKRIDNFKSMFLNTQPFLDHGGQFIAAIIRDMELLRSNAHLFNSDPGSADVRFMADYLRNYFCYCLRTFLKLLQAIALHNDCYEKYDQYIFQLGDVNDFMQIETTDDTKAYLSYAGNRSKMMDYINQQSLVPTILGPNRFPPDLRTQIAVICEVKPPSKSSFFSAVNKSEPLPPANAKKQIPKTTSKASEPVMKITLSSVSADTSGMKSPNSGKGGKRKLDDLPPEPAITLKPPPKKRSNSGSKASASYDVYEDDIDTPYGESYTVNQGRVSTGGASYKSNLAISGEDDYNEGFIDIDDNDDYMVAFTSGPGAVGKGRKSTQKQPKRQSSMGSTIASSSISLKVPSGSSAVTPMVDSRIDRSWYKVADEVIKTLRKHPYVDTMRPTVAADFLSPVIETNPNIRDVYLSRIAEPMDIRTIEDLLATQSFYHPDEFYMKLCRIFQNAIEFNDDIADTSDFLKKMVEKSKYLLKYIKWLCLEKLPVIDDTDPIALQNATKDAIEIAGLSENHVFLLTKSARDNARMEREELVYESLMREFQNLPTSMNSQTRTEITRIGKDPYKECKSTINELLRSKCKRDEENIAFFICPVNIEYVPDYMVFVRNPMDLSTLHFRLDGTKPTNNKIDNLIDKSIPPESYETYGEFFDDCQRIYENAIVYNKAHLQSDNTGISQQIFDIATQFKLKLKDVIIPKHTLTLADRICVCRYLLEGEQAVIKELKRKEEEAKRSQERLLQQLIEEKKAINAEFAMDINPELKRQRTELELRERERAEKKAMIAASNTLLGSLSPVDDMSDTSSPPTSPDHLGAPGTQGVGELALLAVLNKPNIPLIYGYDAAGNVPKQFHDVAKDKVAIAKKAWSLWLPTRHVVVHHSHKQHHSQPHGQIDKRGALLSPQGNGNARHPPPLSPGSTKSDNDSQVKVMRNDALNGHENGEVANGVSDGTSSVSFSKIVMKKKVLQKNHIVQRIFAGDEP